MIRIRDLEPADGDFLGQMLYAALFWDPEKDRLPPEFVLAHPQVSIFHEGWGRPGDTCLVAEGAGGLVGAAWYRLFTEESHGEGFVDERTPELAIAVAEGQRGAGTGGALMNAIAERARTDGFEQLLLSVDPDNPAKRLYARVGYVEYEPGDDLGRMLLPL